LTLYPYSPDIRVMLQLAASPYATASNERRCLREPDGKYDRRGGPDPPAAPVSQAQPGAAQKPRLRDQLIEALQVRHYSIRTEEAYVEWNRRFVLFHGNRPPATLRKREIEQFLTHLAVVRKVSASTQNQALAAILFLYRHVLRRDLEWLDDVVTVVTQVAEARRGHNGRQWMERGVVGRTSAPSRHLRTARLTLTRRSSDD
jgi:hypothetical protein